MFGIVVIVAVVNSISDDAQSPTTPFKPLTPEQQAAKELAGAKLAAAYACRDLVKKTLNDPESSQWDRPWYSEASNQGSVWQVQVTGRVRNQYGALMLSTFECRMIKSGDDWRLVGLRNL